MRQYVALHQKNWNLKDSHGLIVWYTWPYSWVAKPPLITK